MLPLVAAAFTAAAFGWDVHAAGTQTKVLGCRVQQNAAMVRDGHADEAVAHVRDLTDKLDKGLGKVADEAGGLNARLHRAAAGEGQCDGSLTFSRVCEGGRRFDLFRGGPARAPPAPPPVAAFRDGDCAEACTHYSARGAHGDHSAERG
eukprot:gene37251-62968_t